MVFFLKMDVALAVLQLLETSSNFHYHSKMIESSFGKDMSLVSHILRKSPSRPKNLYGSRSLSRSVPQLIFIPWSFSLNPFAKCRALLDFSVQREAKAASHSTLARSYALFSSYPTFSFQPCTAETAIEAFLVSLDIIFCLFAFLSSLNCS